MSGVVDVVDSFDGCDAFFDDNSHGKHILSVQVLFFVSFNRSYWNFKAFQVIIRAQTQCKLHYGEVLFTCFQHNKLKLKSHIIIKGNHTLFAKFLFTKCQYFP